MNKVTIKMVGEHAKVSNATVSRVINGNSYVSPEISRRVEKAIKELNYYPNFAARSLKSDLTYMIGLVVSDIANTYFTEVSKALEKVMNTAGYDVILCSTREDQNREHDYLNKLVTSKKVDGLVLNTTGKNDKYIVSLSGSVPMVLINRQIDDLHFRGDIVDSDNMEGAYALTKHLLSMGHRKILVLNGSQSLSPGILRFDGFKRALAEYGYTVDDSYPYVFNGDFTAESGYEGAARIESFADRPTAVLAMNNSISVGALRYFRSHNIQIPEDISLVTYADIDNRDLLYVQPTFVTLDAWQIGNKAGELLLERLKNPAVPNRFVIYTSQIVTGNSVRQI